MSSTVAIVAAAQAQQQAREAKTVACSQLVSTFNAQSSTVAQAKQYAECVQFLHPDPAGGTEIAIGKALVVLAIIGIVLPWFVARSPHDDAVDKAVMSLLGCISLPFVAALIGGLAYGAWWVVFG